jgi:protein-S-isoprenylcysteine O-methyltransferase Ste14
MFARAVLAFLLLPGMVAFVVPAFFLRPAGPARAFHPIAVAPLTIGSILLLWCVRDFYVSGKGTLAPWSPPQRLVVIGLYRWTRNPMYVAVTVILLGWTAAYRSTTLLTYALIVPVFFHLRVVFGEEPWLARRYGGEWRHYRDQVPRWLW